MKAFIRTLFIFCFLSLILSGCGMGSSQGQPKVVISTDKGKVEYTVEIAATREEREKGLMFRNELPQKHGMFFSYNTPGRLTFWMKNTLIPLDMIFFDANYRVVYIQKNAQPCKSEPCEIYGPKNPTQYVLEISGGESDSVGIKIGDTLEITR